MLSGPRKETASRAERGRQERGRLQKRRTGWSYCGIFQVPVARDFETPCFLNRRNASFPTDHDAKTDSSWMVINCEQSLRRVNDWVLVVSIDGKLACRSLRRTDFTAVSLHLPSPPQFLFLLCMGIFLLLFALEPFMMPAGEGPLHSAAKAVRQQVPTSHIFRSSANVTARHVRARLSSRERAVSGPFAFGMRCIPELDSTGKLTFFSDSSLESG